MRFAREVMPDDYDIIARYFDRSGAYAQFKHFLERRDKRQSWHDFEARATSEAILEWCQVNDIGFIAEPTQGKD